MKVGVETSSLNKRVTGTSRYIQCLINTLSELDIEVKHFPSNNSIRQKTFLSKIQRNWYQLNSIKSEIENYHPDYMIFPNYFMPLNYTAKQQ